MVRTRFCRAGFPPSLTLVLSLGLGQVTAGAGAGTAEDRRRLSGRSGLDVLTRLIAEQVRIDTGMPVIVDNRPGGGGRIAAEACREGRAGRQDHPVRTDRHHRLHCPLSTRI